MAFPRDSLATQLDRFKSDLESRLASGDPRLPANVLYDLSAAIVGAINELHLHLDYNARQVVPDLADEEHLGRYAGWKGIPKTPAAAATGSIDVTGTDGFDVPALTVWQRSDGVQYEVDSTVTIAGGVASVPVTALSTGQITNADAGVKLTLVSPLPGVNGTATVDANTLSGGADVEKLEPWRLRIRKRDREGQAGGSLTDLENWALEVSGVTRAWAFDQWLGLGTAGVFFVRDNDADLIPDASEVQTVQDYIDARRPGATKGVTVIAPVKAPQDMTIAIRPNTAAVQAAVTAELDDMFLRVAQPEDKLGGGIVTLSDVRDAIKHAAGLDDYNLVSPTIDIAPANGNIAQTGVITWQTL